MANKDTGKDECEENKYFSFQMILIIAALLIFSSASDFLKIDFRASMFLSSAFIILALSLCTNAIINALVAKKVQ